MTRLERGDVVTAMFFKDKPRTGVVVRSSAYAASENVTLCPITSTLAGGPLRVLVRPGASGLNKESEVMPYRITTLPGQRVGKVIGRLSKGEIDQINAVLREWLDV